MTSSYDVAIIGGGPAGAVAGALLAEAGHDVALFEAMDFPRFHVGESLVPAVNATLDRVGVLEAMESRGYTRKHGVQFHTPKGATRPFYFSEASNADLHHTWQVLRSDFDGMLLDAARQAGVAVSMRTRVVEVVESDGAVRGVRIKRDGGEADVAARVVLDASGYASSLARRLGQRRTIAGLENGSLFAHYKDVRRDTGIDAGSTLIFRLSDGAWLWLIPLPETVSVGLVAPAKSLASYGTTQAEILGAAIAQSEPLSERLANATRTTDVLFARDFTYRAECDGGVGWALLGDALGFIDPIYSTGLFLSLLSAELGASAVGAALSNGSDRPDLAGFSEKYQGAFGQFLALVRAFYTPDFHFGQLAKDPANRRGLVDLLTGDVGTQWAVKVANTIRASIAGATEMGS